MGENQTPCNFPLKTMDVQNEGVYNKLSTVVTHDNKEGEELSSEDEEGYVDVGYPAPIVCPGLATQHEL